MRLADDLRHYLAGRGGPGVTGKTLPRTPDPSDRDLVHLGQRLGLDLGQAVVLVLKGQWERFQARRDADSDARDHPDAPPWHREFHVGAGGSADPTALYRLFEAEHRLASGAGYDAESFQTLVQHSVLLGLHRLSFHGPEVRAFAASQRAQQALLAMVAPAEREAFWDSHRLWREMEEEVGSLVLAVERQALENRQVERQWLETFGAAYVPLLEAEARCRALERSIARKAENPNLSREELADLEAADLEGVALEMARLRREIYRLTHPDAVGQHGFTERQSERLLGHYREAVAFADTSRIADEPIDLGIRSLPSLQAILARVRKIWETRGLDVNEGAAIRGDTLAERREWLEARIAELEEQPRQVRADLVTAAHGIPSVGLWETPSGKSLCCPGRPPATVTCVAFPPDEPTLLPGVPRTPSCSGSRGPVPRWDPWAATRLRFPPWPRGAGGRICLTACLDGTAALWSVDAQMPLQRLEGPAFTIRAVALCSDGCFALTDSAAQRSILWELESGR
jgi:hypothetical protein